MQLGYLEESMPLTALMSHPSSRVLLIHIVMFVHSKHEFMLSLKEKLFNKPLPADL
jgi:hypothetical protein